MGEEKYGKVLVIVLAVLIIIVFGTITYFIVDYVQKSDDRIKASQFAGQIENEITGDGKNKDKTNEIQSNNVELNIQLENIISGTEQQTEGENKKTYKGYEMSGTIRIPKIDLNLPVLTKADAKSIDVSVAINGGPGLNKVGNTIIIGHNYRDGRFFADLKKLTNGDKIYITDNGGVTIEYKVYNIYTTAPEDSAFMERDTQGAREITLDTCTDDTQSRLIIWAKEV